MTFVELRKADFTDMNYGPKVSIYSYRAKKWVDFPHPLLGLPLNPDSGDLLPAVLTSLSLALLDVNEQGAGTPLIPYQSLLDSSSKNPSYGVSKIISDYILGTGPIKSEQVMEPESRKSQLLQELSDALRDIQVKFETEDALPSPFELSPLFDWREMVVAELNSVIEIVRKTNTQSSTTPTKTI